jgi:hypothetical protein
VGFRRGRMEGLLLDGFFSCVLSSVGGVMMIGLD